MILGKSTTLASLSDLLCSFFRYEVIGLRIIPLIKNTLFIFSIIPCGLCCQKPCHNHFNIIQRIQNLIWSLLYTYTIRRERGVCGQKEAQLCCQNRIFLLKKHPLLKSSKMNYFRDKFNFSCQCMTDSKLYYAISYSIILLD